MRWFLLLIISASAVWAQPLVDVETVPVGDPRNAPNVVPTGYGFDNLFGSVAYSFRIGRYEVTISQYATFLTSVASVASHDYLRDLWSPGMAANSAIGGSIARSGSGTELDPYVFAVIGNGQRPITHVSFFDAARFANWLHNGATNGASTETGAYTLNGAAAGVPPPRNPDAQWWIPNSSEWYKSAFYKGGGTNSGYWLYPTQSDFPPAPAVDPSTSQSLANYNNIRPFGDTLSQVGAYTNSPSSYGTYDQGGNVWEWQDDDFGGGVESRMRRGGSWLSTSGGLSSSTGNAAVNATEERNEYGFRVAASEAAPSPRLAVQAPSGSVLSNSAAASVLPSLLSSTSDARVYTVVNIGSSVLSNIVVTKFGSDSSHFLLTAPTVDSLEPAATTTFSVSFAPTFVGAHTAQISITSNDTNNSPFVINLSGFGLGEDLDSDGDGLNDAAEFTMSDLGFDWQSNQPTLVTALYSNANRANLFTQSQYDGNRSNGQTDVTTDPSAFNLFTQSQFNGNRTAGQQDVIASPIAYGLYDSTSIMDLRMGGLIIQKQGTDATIVFQPQTTTDLATQPFTNNGTPITNTIPMPENKGFLRVGAVYVPTNDLIDPTPEPTPVPPPTPPSYEGDYGYN